MKKPLFTPEELEELRAFDAMVDDEPMTLAEYEALDFIEGLLFPEKEPDREKDRARRRAYYESHREECLEACRVYHEKHKDEISARKARWYQENKDRILAKQREYRIRTGQTRTPEQREADKIAHSEARKAKAKAEREAGGEEYLEKQRQYQLAYRAKKKGMTVDEYLAYQEAKKKAVLAVTAGAESDEERRKAYQRAYREAHREVNRAYQREYQRMRRSGQRGQSAAAMT